LIYFISAPLSSSYIYFARYW